MTVHSSYEEKTLLIQLRRGNPEAFTTIYLHYWKKLYVLAYHRLKSRPTAEDVVQEVLSGLWMRRKTLTIHSSLNAYLATATRYAILRSMANDKSHTVLPDTAPEETAYPYDSRFLEEMLQKEINTLPEKCKLVFKYSRTAGLSNKEIASQLQVSEKAVEKHITKALNKLRKLIHFLFL